MNHQVIPYNTLNNQGFFFAHLKLRLYIWRSCHLHPKLFKSEKFGNSNSTRIFWEQNHATTKPQKNLNSRDEVPSMSTGGLGWHVAQLLRTTNCGSEIFWKKILFSLAMCVKNVSVCWQEFCSKRPRFTKSCKCTLAGLRGRRPGEEAGCFLTKKKHQNTRGT